MRTYQDISHFRAPYKNYQTLAGFGIDTGTPAAAAWTQYAAKAEDGVLYYNAEARKQITDQLVFALPLQMDTAGNEIRAEMANEQTLADIAKAFAANDTTSLEVFLRASAAKWVQDKVKAGFAIYATGSALDLKSAAGTTAGARLLAVPATDYAKAKSYSVTEPFMGAFLDAPKDGWVIPAGTEIVPAGISDPKNALIALAIVGGAGILFFGLAKVMERRRGRMRLAGSLAR